ncbi:hypothetical protein HDU93_000514 [Gonapodya sp. JEL0774]|nr:hypothetical protein HDU93_000514 [Gonapodya sp. JEL0774]
MTSMVRVLRVELPLTSTPAKLLHTHIHKLASVHYDEFGPGFADCTAANRNQSKCYGGAARMKYVIDGLRANATTPSLLLDGGDQFQGNQFFSYYKGTFSNITADFVNILGYDVMSLGNHEFDNGPNYLAKYIQQVNLNKTSFVSANLAFNPNTTDELRAVVMPYVIKNVSGVPICFIGGVTNSTPAISSPGPNITFDDPAIAAQKAIDACKAKGPKIAILVTHIGYDVDKDLGRRYVLLSLFNYLWDLHLTPPGIPSVSGVQLIIGGHSHSLLLANASEAVGDTVVGYYPSNVTNLDGKPTYVVQVLWAGKYIGNLDVTWDADTGDLLTIAGKPILLTQATPKDAALNATVAVWRAPFDALSKVIIGSTIPPMPRSICYSRDCALGLFVTSAMLNATRPFGAQLALINTGGMRIDILAGDMTQGDVLTLLPFANYLVVYNFTGQQLLDTFESVTAKNGSNNIITGKSVAGAFMQLSGARFLYNSSIAATPRVLGGQVLGNDGKWADIVKTQTYAVTTLDFVATGGDALVTNVVAAGQLPSLSLLSDVAIDYVKAASPLNFTANDAICDLGNRTCSWSLTTSPATTSPSSSGSSDTSPTATAKAGGAAAAYSHPAVIAILFAIASAMVSYF